MRSRRALSCVLLLGAAGLGCQEARASKPRTKPAASAAASAAPADSAAPAARPDPGPMPLPFAWERDAADPLARARALLGEVGEANARYSRQRPGRDGALGRDQRPRATLLTCADSRVQVAALDGTPEHDLFVVRNAGNQVPAARGSLAYGVTHLHTPLLLVVGHTGCGAVKARLSAAAAAPQADAAHGSPAPEAAAHRGAAHDPHGAPIEEDPHAASEAAIATELATVVVAGDEPDPGLEHALRRLPEAARAPARGAVVNVRHQVALALRDFGREVRAGELTVVGMIEDLHGVLGEGPGRVWIVDVNGHHEPERLRAFARTVGDRASLPVLETPAPAATPAARTPTPAPAATSSAAPPAAAPPAGHGGAHAAH